MDELEAICREIGDLNAQREVNDERLYELRVQRAALNDAIITEQQDLYDCYVTRNEDLMSLHQMMQTAYLHLPRSGDTLIRNDAWVTHEQDPDTDRCMCSPVSIRTCLCELTDKRIISIYHVRKTDTLITVAVRMLTKTGDAALSCALGTHR